jgi:hypothetical protein
MKILQVTSVNQLLKDCKIHQTKLLNQIKMKSHLKKLIIKIDLIQRNQWSQFYVLTLKMIIANVMEDKFSMGKNMTILKLSTLILKAI